jgi:hypothetical protein
MNKLYLVLKVIFLCMFVYGVVINVKDNNIANLLAIIIAILIVKD